ncbi:MAG: PAS domain S-box protein [Deferrisomatales bacterium]
MTAPGSPWRLLAGLAAAVFAAELAAMAAAHAVATSGHLGHYLLDASFLVLFLTPALYGFVYRPLRRHLDDLERSRAHLQRLEGILEATPDFVAMAGPDGAVQYVNRGGRRLLGLGDRTDLAGRRIGDAHPPWAAELVARVAIPAAIDGGSWRGETAFRAADGGEVPMDQTVLAHRGPTGNVEFLSTIARDVTERRRAEAEGALRTALLDTLGALVVVLDREGRIIQFNRACEALTGYRVDEVRGRTLWEVLLVPEEADAVRERIAPLAAGHFPNEHENHWVAVDGTRSWIAWRNAALLGPDGEVEHVIGTGIDLTGRRDAERRLAELHRELEARVAERTAELTESERRLSTLLANLPGMAYRCRNDAAWSMELVSEGCRDLTGHPPEALLGNRDLAYADLIDPADRDRVWDGVQAALAEDRPFELTYRLRRADGEERWVWERGVGVRGPAGELRGLEGFISDVTDRHRAEERLREAGEQFRATFEQAAVGIAHVGLDGRWLRVNRRLCDIVGYSRDELLARTFQDITHPGDLAADLAVVRQVLAGEISTYSMEKRYLRKNATVVWINLTVSLVRDASGEPKYFISVVEDIHRRKRAEEEAGRWARIFEHAGWGVAICSAAEARIELANPAFAEMHGCSVAELVGSPMADVFAPESRAELAANIGRVNELGHHAFEAVHRRRDGSTFPVYVASTAIRGEGGEVLYRAVNVQDITPLKQSEARLQALAAELARSNRELEQFAYVASHDLQEPLRMVVSYLGLLERRYAASLGGDAREFIAYAMDGGRRLQRLVEDLLAYSRVGTRGSPPKPVASGEALAEALANLALAVAEAGASVEAGDLPVVLADRGQLVQVFQNLVSNAVKFRGAEPPRVRVGAERRGGEWVFRVADNGIGLDPADRERIFQVFQRLHGPGEYPGTGIGLAVVKKIVERHGGRVWVESEPGRGAVFCFTLRGAPDGP